MADFVDDLLEIKKLISHNIGLFRLNDFIRANPRAAYVQSVCQGSNFNPNSLPWYTSISSLYSSIALVSEYIGKKNDVPNDLDTGFTNTTWNIHLCYQHDDSGNKDTSPPDLNVIIPRLRNSISHGKFELLKPNAGEIRSWKIVFKDFNKFKKPTDPKRNFYLEIMATDFQSFLEVMERKFNLKYP